MRLDKDSFKRGFGSAYVITQLLTTTIHLGTESQSEHRVIQSRYNTIHNHYVISIGVPSVYNQRTMSSQRVRKCGLRGAVPVGTRGRRAMAYPVLYTLEVMLSLHIGPYHHKVISRRHTVMFHLL